MRIRSQLLYALLAILFVILSIVEASKKHRKKKSKQSKNEKSALSTVLFDTSVGPGREIPVKSTSGSSSKPGKAPQIVGGSKGASVSSAVPKQPGTASGDVLEREFRKAVDGADFGWLKANVNGWLNRKGLPDYVLGKGVDFTVKLIRSFEGNTYVLIGLLPKASAEMTDEVLRQIKYDDGDLIALVIQLEPGDSPKKFLTLLTKINYPYFQRSAITAGITVFARKNLDLLVYLVDALGEGAFKNEHLRDEMVRHVFVYGINNGIQRAVEEYHGHPVITSLKYAHGLHASWEKGESSPIFLFLLAQADQDDLGWARSVYAHEKHEKFRQAIGNVSEGVPPAGSRHERFNKGERFASSRAHSQLLWVLECGGKELGNIVASYLPDGEEEPEAIGGVNFEKGKKNIENAFPHIEGNEDEVMSSVVPRSADVVGDGFKRAVGSDDFGWLNKHREGWELRDDLPNYVIAEGPDVTVKLIKNVKDKNAKRCLLAALFDRGGGMIDQVLGRISYKDEDLWRLTDYRPELASSHEKLFNILDKIEAPGCQSEVVQGGIINLFKAGMHDSIIPLVKALDGRAFKNGNLKKGQSNGHFMKELTLERFYKPWNFENSEFFLRPKLGK